MMVVGARFLLKDLLRIISIGIGHKHWIAGSKLVVDDLAAVRRPNGIEPYAQKRPCSAAHRRHDGYPRSYSAGGIESPRPYPDLSAVSGKSDRPRLREKQLAEPPFRQVHK